MPSFDPMIKFKNDGIQRPIDKGEHHRFAIRRLEEVERVIIICEIMRGRQSEVTLILTINWMERSRRNIDLISSVLDRLVYACNM